MTEPHRDRGRWLLPLLLLVAAVAYREVLRFGFVWDDFACILQNSPLREGGNLPRLLLQGDAAGTGLTNPYFRPVTTATFALGLRLWGENPAGYHATNLLLHLSACGALFLAGRRTGLRPEAAFAGALLFALHPAVAEPVAYVCARADLLSTLFSLLSFHAWLGYAERRRRRDLALSAALYLVAVFSKISAAVLPPLLLLHMLLHPPGRVRWKALLPHGAVTALFLAAREAAPLLEAWVDAPLWLRVLNAGPFLATYVRNALFPAGLRIFYDLPYRTSPLDPEVLLGWGTVAALASVTFLLRRRSPGTAFGLAWFLLALLPVSGIVLVLFPAHVADRYLYLPLAGLALAAGAMAERFLARGGAVSPGAVASVATAALLLALVTAARLQPWRSDLSFWQAAAASAPRSGFVQGGLGQSLVNAGRHSEGHAALRKARELGEDHAGIRLNLARALLALGDGAAGEFHAREALRLAPDSPSAMNALGVALAMGGRMDEAIGCFRSALRDHPRYAEATANLRQALATREALLVRDEPSGRQAD